MSAGKGGGVNPTQGFQKGHKLTLRVKPAKLPKPPKPPRLKKDGTLWGRPKVVGKPFVKGWRPKGISSSGYKGPNRKTTLNPPEGLTLLGTVRRALSTDEKLHNLGFDALVEIVKMLEMPLLEGTRAKLLCEVASYQYSKKRSVEVTGADAGPIQVTIRRFELPTLTAVSAVTKLPIIAAAGE